MDWALQVCVYRTIEQFISFSNFLQIEDRPIEINL